MKKLILLIFLTACATEDEKREAASAACMKSLKWSMSLSDSLDALNNIGYLDTYLNRQFLCRELITPDSYVKPIVEKP